ncbi:MAG: arginase [Anaerolineae bacterium]|nr:arginase [Anaerolineae bacterium]MDW8171437.1 arginase [Anaerolineae bacterium]
MRNKIRIFGVPMDMGQKRRGVDMGPSAIRYAGLQEKLESLGYAVCDSGNVEVSQQEEVLDSYNDSVRVHYLPQVAQICRAAYDRIHQQLQPDEIGVFLGGDHSISIGTVSAIHQRGKIGVLWVDAHADFNTPETSPSGNIHGMVLAVLLGDGPHELTVIGGSQPKLKPCQVAMVGVRDVDPHERLRLLDSGINVHTIRTVDEHGMSSVAHNILAQFADCDYLHVSLDLDSCEPQIAPGVGTPVDGGLSYREAHLLMEILADSGKVGSVDVVEINPILDVANRTAIIAAELLASLLGKRIL